MIRTVSLLGFEFADLGVRDAAALIGARPSGAPFAYVVTPNADHLVRLSRDTGMAALYRGAWLRLLDSRVVAGLHALTGRPTPAVTTGSDLTAALLSDHLRPGERVTIIGLDPRHLPVLVRRLGLAPPLHHNPPMGFDRDPRAFAAAVDFVRANPARLVFLAVGSPRQERLAAALAEAGATGTGLCIGASLDFLSGAERRAPVWMREHGLEWAFRLTRDPRRMARRYLLDCPRVLPLLLRELRRGA